MGVTLLILACLGADNCRPLAIMGGFVNERQCTVYSDLMLEGWKARNPQAAVERWICTTSPERIIGAWQT